MPNFRGWQQNNNPIKTRIMRKIILLTIAIISACISLLAQENDPIRKKVLEATEEYNFLKDFNIKVKPNMESRYSIVLSKNTIYNFSYYEEEPNQIELKLFTVSDTIKSKINRVNQVNQFNYTPENTGVYHLFVKNITNKEIETNVLLSFLDQVEKTEIISITKKDTKGSATYQTTEKIEKPEEIFFVVEDMPTFNGEGNEEFKKYLRENLKYPQEAIDEKISGRVFVQFVVDKNGYIKDAKVVRGVHPALDQEALRVIYSSPKWEPGRQRNIPVNVSYTFPIIFKLP